MDKKQIEKIARDKAREHFPEMEEASLEVKKVDTGTERTSFKKAGIKETPGKKIWIATLQQEITTEEGLPIKKVARITVDDDGNVLKVSESR